MRESDNGCREMFGMSRWLAGLLAAAIIKAMSIPQRDVCLQRQPNLQNSLCDFKQHESVFICISIPPSSKSRRHCPHHTHQVSSSHTNSIKTVIPRQHQENHARLARRPRALWQPPPARHRGPRRHPLLEARHHYRERAVQNGGRLR